MSYYTKTYTYNIPAGQKNTNNTYVATGVTLQSNETLNSITIDDQTVMITNHTSSTLSYPRFDFAFYGKSGSLYGSLHTEYFYAPTANNITTLPADSSSSSDVEELTYSAIDYGEGLRDIYVRITGLNKTGGEVLAVNSISLGAPLKFTFNVTVYVPSYTVTVSNGSGSGDYEENAEVAIIANSPASGKVFDKWTGIDGLSFIYGNENTPYATFRMPDNNVTVTATYRDKSGAISSAGRYDGTSFNAVVPMMYDGEAWVECDVSMYDGTDWISVCST